MEVFEPNLFLQLTRSRFSLADPDLWLLYILQYGSFFLGGSRSCENCVRAPSPTVWPCLTSLE